MYKPVNSHKTPANLWITLHPYLCGYSVHRYRYGFEKIYPCHSLLIVSAHLQRLLVFLGSHVSFATIDLSGVFEADAVKHVARDMVGSVRKLSQESISISVFF